MLSARSFSIAVIAMFNFWLNSSLAADVNEKDFQELSSIAKEAIASDSERYAQDLNEKLSDKITGMVRLVGLKYLRVDGVEIDYEVAALLLGYAHSESKYRRDPKEDIMTGYAAYVTALKYSDKKSVRYDPARAMAMHRIASAHDIQESSLAVAYMIRSDTDDGEAGLAAQSTYFKRASWCTEDNKARDVLPFSAELCTVAAQEVAQIQERYGGSVSRYGAGDPSSWPLLVILGLAVLAIEQGATENQLDRYEQPKIYEPSYLEQYLWDNPKG